MVHHTALFHFLQGLLGGRSGVLGWGFTPLPATPDAFLPAYKAGHPA